MDIKNLKPSRASRYQQGYINPSTCKKLINNDKPIIFRSSYERKFVMWLENCDRVSEWSNESIGIPYTWPDGSQHTYYPDYYMVLDGVKYIIEIKPSNQTRKPTNNNAWLMKEWMKNVCKWNTTKEFASSRGMKFMVLTENTINNLK